MLVLRTRSAHAGLVSSPCRSVFSTLAWLSIFAARARRSERDCAGVAGIDDPVHRAAPRRAAVTGEAAMAMRMSHVELQRFSVPHQVDAEFETDQLDLRAARFRVVELTPEGALVARVSWTESGPRSARST
jgi:hypothetical protein